MASSYYALDGRLPPQAAWRYGPFNAAELDTLPAERYVAEMGVAVYVGYDHEIPELAAKLVAP